MIVFETEEPGTTDTVVAEFASEKLKGSVTVNDDGAISSTKSAVVKSKAFRSGDTPSSEASVGLEPSVV